MKKLLFSSAALVLLTVCIHAQEKATQVGFTAGATFSKFKASFDGESETGKTLVGPTAGILVNIPLAKNLCFQPALHWVSKGARDEDTYGGITEKFIMRVNVIEVPLNLLFNHTSNAGTFFIGGGPSASLALAGKEIYKYGVDRETTEINFGNSEDDDMKALEIGLNALSGFRFPNGLSISGHFNAGLSNLIPGDVDEIKLKSRYFAVKLGWLLKSSK